MTDDEIEKLLLDNGFTENQLNKLRRAKKEQGVSYLIQLKELRKFFLTFLSLSLVFVFVFVFVFFLAVDFSDIDSISSLSFAFFILFASSYFFSSMPLSLKAFLLILKNKSFL